MRLPPLAPGHSVESYRLQSKLGQGAFGRVFQAVHDGTGTEVALKVIGLPDSTIGQAERQKEIWRRFDREVSVCRLLTHPRVVRLLDSGVYRWENDSFPWFCMELIAGGTSLSKAYRNAPGIPWLLDRTEEVLDILVYLHGRDIIHRDIKPDNVLIARDGRLCLVDFGLVRVVQGEKERITHTGQALGTVQYMSLEQLGNSKNVDARADLYSLGMMLFEMLEDVKNWAAILPDIMCAGGVTFTQDLPEPLQAFIRKLTAPSPAHRYASAGEALTVLRQVRSQIER